MLNTINIRIPSLSDVLSTYCEIYVDRWKTGCFADIGTGRGVYIIHQETEVLYVGQTCGKKMDYKTRLYRHFTKRAAQNKGIYLQWVARPKPLRVSFVPEAQIRKLISNIAMDYDRLQDEVILLMEAALTVAYKPLFRGRQP